MAIAKKKSIFSKIADYFIKNDPLKLVILIAVLAVLFFLLKNQVLGFFDWISTLGKKKNPTETPQGSTLTNEQVLNAKNSLAESFNYILGDDEDIMTLLQPLNSQDLIRIKKAFGTWYRHPVNGQIRQGWVAGLFLSSKNLYQLLKEELDQSNYEIIKAQFSDVLI